MKVAQWIRTHPGPAVTVVADAPLRQVAKRLLAESHLRDLYVVDGRGEIIGRLSHERLAKHILAAHRPRATRRELFERLTDAPAKELMNRHFVTAHPDEELDEVLAHMIEHHVEDLPVVDDERRVVGTVNLTEVLRVFHEEEGFSADPSSNS